MTSDQQAELEQYRKAAREYHESVERRLGNLRTLEQQIGTIERSLDKLEDMASKPTDPRFPPNAATADVYIRPVATSTSRCVVTEAQVEYWERVEVAARHVLEHHEGWLTDECAPECWAKLREALKP